MKMISDSAVLFYFSPQKIKYLHYKNIDAIFFCGWNFFSEIKIWLTVNILFGVFKRG